MEESQKVLHKELADLLGFEDGAEDVLEHLLTIDSREDLLDYLSQLLGSAADKVRSFVDNIVAFQNGQVLSAPLTAVEPTPTIPPQNKSGPPTSNKPKKDTVPSSKPAAAKAKPPAPTSTSSTTTTTKPSTTQTTKDAPPVTKPAFVPDTNQSTKMEDSIAKPPPKSVPQKGKASYVCGCYGTRHKVLANCLVCGRISCEREGYDFCPYCGILVEKPPQGVSRTDPAWLHKERLLRFDRESAQRMVVIDDESDDHYANPMAWLTPEESEAAAEKQAEREQNLRQRPKMQLDLAL